MKRGRPKLNRIKKTYSIEKQYLRKIKIVDGKNNSDKMNRILFEYFEFIGI
jgi:hypothetical protein